VFVSGGFDLATRAGEWLCGQLNAADGAPLVDPAGQWSLWGLVPYSTVQRAVVLEGTSADGLVQYSLY
jgi:hypothetical protein